MKMMTSNEDGDTVRLCETYILRDFVSSCAIATRKISFEGW